ncbi:hypothetical protein [Flavobacterium sp. J27]|uniref:hypothetical protein n=1 Tax=Flavobacterium sp. J27 TaxID=2060419 RepID=UPI001031E368|nr:hypothetical protein [Flavobacterium sp. J27]
MKKTILFSVSLLTTLVSCNLDETVYYDNVPQVKIFTSSNTSGKISYTNLLANNAATFSLSVNGTDNDGIFYDNDADEVIVASRTNNRLERYSGLKNSVSSNVDNLTLDNFSSNTDFTNPREIAVTGDKIIVTQDQAASNGNTNKLFVYQKTNSGFTLLNQYTVDFKLWGIHVNGNDLYAIADLTSDLVVFTNFFSLPSGSITPTKRVTIEGLTRTHGITFSNQDNVMILTDVADAASDSDGGVVIINNFTNVLNSTSNMGTIAMNNQIRIYGSETMLGNPVDVAYDYVTNRIFVAERANGGGKVLAFVYPTVSGNLAPISSRTELGVAGIYLVRK